jgi:predicted MFS family arabinose efflux permease
LAVLIFARMNYPRPQELEQRSAQFIQPKGFSKAYWTYLAAGALMACGFADFSLIAFHFHRTAVVSHSRLLGAMAAGALAAPLLGRLLDRVGLPALLVGFTFPASSAPLVFLGGWSWPCLANPLGHRCGCTGFTPLKAVLARIVPPERRSTAFGVFDSGFGVAWFAGSAATGLLCDRSILAVVLFSSVLQLAALPVLYLSKRRERAGCEE